MNKIILLSIAVMIFVSCENKKESPSSDFDGLLSDNENNDDIILPDNEKQDVEIIDETDVEEDVDNIENDNDNDSAISPDKDSDSDGIPDVVEMPNGVPVDTDEDGTPDYLDTESDGDKIPDSVECPSIPCRDSDSDGTYDYRDTDSDDDGILDSIEAQDPLTPVDSDSDGTADYIDTDSDNDGVKDLYESAKDADGDKTPNYLDLDSDDDGIADCIEKYGTLFRDTDKDGYPDCKAAHDYSTPPADTDKDKAYDFIDMDSDGDGLSDSDEVICPNLKKDGRVFGDVDGDGFSDLAEVAVGSKICDKNQGVTDIEGINFYFELPYGGPVETDTLTFSPSVQKADIFFSIDTTGSMDGEIYNLKHTLSSVIIPQTRAKITDSAYGVTQFRDENEPSLIQNNPSTNTMTAQISVNNLVAEFGGDGPEAGYFSLYNMTANGVFRGGSIPIAIHITDAVSHERGASKTDTISALTAKGIKTITVFSLGGYDGVNAQTQLNELSSSTGAVVPECAGAGRTTLFYSIAADGSGLDTAVVNGIDALVKYAVFDVYALPADDNNSSTIDTSCFLKEVEAVEFIAPPGDTCAPVAQIAKLNGSVYDNGFTNFVTGTSNPEVTGTTLKFTVHAQNDTCVKQTDHAQAFTAVIHIVDAVSGAYLDSQNVTIIVPPEIPGLGDD